MNLEKEAGAIKSLLEKADKLETDADLKIVQADDLRWEAAERVYNLIVLEKATTQKAFAQITGYSTGHVSRLVRVWQWWLENGSGGRHGSVERPTFYNAEELTRDAALAQRAASLGKAPSTVAKSERDARTIVQAPASAKKIVEDKKARASLKRAINEIEAEEDAAEAEAIRQKALADKAAAGRSGIDSSPPSTKFGLNAELEAGALLGQAMKALTRFIRLVHDRGPVPDNARGVLLEELEDLQARVEWAVEAVNNGITDWDEALAQFAGE